MSPHDSRPADGTIRVLLVDDPDSVALAAALLERARDGFAAVTATSASDGLDRLAEEDIDCVVSDYRMPGMDGLDFLTAVRERHPGLPFILFTGEGSEEIASRAISAGVDDYLRKEPGTDQFTLLANRIANVTR